MSNELKIEKGIPHPSNCYGKWVNILSKMEIGDSFIVKSRKESNRAISSTNHRKKYRVSSRKQPDGTYRIWRVK